jgi:hypothetical protein
MIQSIVQAICRAPVIHDAICVVQGRSGKWPTVRKRFLKGKKCAFCGGKKMLEAHHKEPFHANPAKELDEDNLIAVCNHLFCHLVHGHFCNYKLWNRHVESDAAAYLAQRKAAIRYCKRRSKSA